MPKFRCPHCKALISQSAKAAAAPVICPYCQSKIKSTPAPARKTPHASAWLITGLASAGVSVVLGLALLAGYLYLGRDKTPGAEQAKGEKLEVQNPPGEKESPKTTSAPVKNNGKEEKKPTPPQEKWTEPFLKRLNRQRKSAGLASVTLDEELSRGCLAHARYVAKNVDPKSAAAAVNLAEEDAQKPGYSPEGQRAGRSALVVFAAPHVALDHWMGRLADRLALLNTEMQKIGLGFAQNSKGDWICVLDPVHGRGERIVLYPAPKQQEVPLSFSAGPEVPDAGAAAGFPITVTFPPARQVSNAHIELRDDKGSVVDGWSWTPDKPVSKTSQRNSIALIPKGMLRSQCLYQVKASAQVDGKAWSSTWSFTTEDDSDSKGLWAKKALAKINDYRTRAGLMPVALDEKLGRGCLAHARYLVLNADHPATMGLGAHDEDAKLPGYSEQGHKAGKASDIAIGDNDPLANVDAWMATLYHRVPILEPNLKTIGFGCVRGRRLGWTTVLNVVSGKETGPPTQPVFYPAPAQTQVPVNFPNEGEDPNPIPEDKDGRAGYPITAFFPKEDPLKKATGKVTNARGEEVPCWFSSPEKPANPKFADYQGQAICLIPKKPLDANTTYQVRIQGQRAGKNWEKQWKFTTGDAGLSIALATRQVLDRLNQARLQAGLGKVVLDDQLSQGCQLHAEYLVANADTLKKQNASVFDEDPKLPGFTKEGWLAARHATVFSNALVPVTQIDDLLATFTRRVAVLDPHLQRIGFGCAHDIGRGWRCVLDLSSGRGDTRILLYPAPGQDDVPCASSERPVAIKAKALGFPISVTFPNSANPRNVQAVLTDANGKDAEVWIAAPDKAANEKLPPSTIALYPLTPLQPGQTYSVTVSAIVNAAEWRQTWQFTTSKSPR